MRKKWCLVLAFAAACLVGSLPAVRAEDDKEEKVALDKLPKAIVSAVKKRFPKAKMVEAAKEKEDGKTVYEVTVKENGKNIDVTFTPAGDLVGIEKEIAFADLPKNVQAAVGKKYPKGKDQKAEEVVKVVDGKEKFQYYEVHLTDGDKKDVEVKVGADGKIIEDAKK